MNTIKSLEWRYATKQFDSDKKLTEEELNSILKAINLAPSSFGLQPFNIIVVEDPTIRIKLKEAAYNQSQVTDASHVIIFAATNNLSNTHAEEFIKRISKITDVTIESLAEYEGMLKNKLNSKNSEELFVWASKQCYIALGFLLTTCAQMGIDACPMEGFDPKKFDGILNLDELNLNSVVMAAIGHRSPEDKYQYNPKVRKELNDLIIRL